MIKQRLLTRWKGILYAITFLLALTLFDMHLQETEKNHFEILGVDRNTPIHLIKKAYRNLSLELHPDKNKSPSSAEDFRRVSHSYNVLTNRENRAIYERFGDVGIRTSKNIVIDTKYVILNSIVSYGSTSLFLLLMTFSEPSGDAMKLSLLGMFIMMLIEALLVLDGPTFVPFYPFTLPLDLPPSLFPQTTPHGMIRFLHKIYPAYINICRALTGAFYVNERSRRADMLLALSATTRISQIKTAAIVDGFLYAASRREKVARDAQWARQLDLTTRGDLGSHDRDQVDPMKTSLNSKSISCNIDVNASKGFMIPVLEQHQQQLLGLERERERERDGTGTGPICRSDNLETTLIVGGSQNPNPQNDAPKGKDNKMRAQQKFQQTSTTDQE